MPKHSTIVTHADACSSRGITWPKRDVTARLTMCTSVVYSCAADVLPATLEALFVALLPKHEGANVLRTTLLAVNFVFDCESTAGAAEFARANAVGRCSGAIALEDFRTLERVGNVSNEVRVACRRKVQRTMRDDPSAAGAPAALPERLEDRPSGALWRPHAGAGAGAATPPVEPRLLMPTGSSRPWM